MNLKEYKIICRELKITHDVIAKHIGHTRESVTLWLNGKEVPEVCGMHIKKEIDNLIKKVSRKIEI